MDLFIASAWASPGMDVGNFIIFYFLVLFGFGSLLVLSFLQKLFSSSVTKQMAYHADVPLLAFHHQREAVMFI